ncbi:AsmA family protein [Novosphingobium profundi]|uniref:AsmA family protein n=1 Tax=Novosphingobium profundi TaxID=1774954 RepID=UPI001BDA5F48|nr:AsmA family protein [Novosphingobium profundi]MBT0670583.1 AsmA family protein [Novosphingobium profundi]
MTARSRDQKKAKGRNVDRVGRILVALATIAALLVLGAAAFPFSLVKGPIADRLGARLGTHVSIGAIERHPALSFTPTLVLHDVTIRQPAWAGPGNMAQAQRLTVRIALLPLLVGDKPAVERIDAEGLTLSLVRDSQGRANWLGPRRQPAKEDEPRSARGHGFLEMYVRDAHVSLRDVKRALALEGRFSSDAAGLQVEAKGRFHDSPATLSLRGGRIAALAADARYPITLEFTSPLLQLRASGHSQGALDLQSMTLAIQARAPSLGYLDDMIEAGLFGTQPIDLDAHVRHLGPDWFIDSLTGSIGRSKVKARATILKRAGRTKIDADTHFSQFAFDDLSDSQGRARARAIEARTGPRVLPGTRINLAKVGPTDGTIRFIADQLLLPKSVFRSLSGRLTLKGKRLTVEDIDARMKQGRMTGHLAVDQRGGAAHPQLSLDLAVEDARLESVLGSADATGPLRAHIVLSGTGDTIREALGRANGRAGVVVHDGRVKRILAAVLGQDLGKTLGALLKDKEKMVPLRCLAIGFQARDGRLAAQTFLADTGISIGQGRGELSLSSEGIALSIQGRSRDSSALRLKDPIVVGGTFSAPTLSAAGHPPGNAVNVGTVLSAIGNSVGNALGLDGQAKEDAAELPNQIDCPALTKRVL